MRTLFRFLPLLALAAAPVLAQGEARSASMQVSFTVVAACTVNPTQAGAPAVACSHADAFRLVPAASSGHTAQDGAWTVYF